MIDSSKVFVLVGLVALFIAVASLPLIFDFSLLFPGLLPVLPWLALGAFFFLRRGKGFGCGTSCRPRPRSSC